MSIIEPNSQAEEELVEGSKLSQIIFHSNLASARWLHMPKVGVGATFFTRGTAPSKIIIDDPPLLIDSFSDPHVYEYLLES